MNKILLILLLVNLIFVSGCIHGKFTPDLLQENGKTWVEINPIQCLGNPWEIDWLQKNNYSYDDYPQTVHTPKLEQEEIEIIKNYYEEQGIRIFGVASYTFEEKSGKPVAVCAACNCPEGYTLYLQISDTNLSKMIELGYKTVE